MQSIRKARARPATHRALSHTPSRVLGEAWGVSPSRARHKRTEGDNCVTDTCALITTPEIDGAAIVGAILEALERRYLEEAKASPTKARARLDHLTQEKRYREQAALDRALQSGEGAADAALDLSRTLIEIAAYRRVLGLDR